MFGLGNRFTCAVREFLFIPQGKQQILDSLSMVRGEIYALRTQIENEPCLATVTILGETIDHDFGLPRPTVIGGEVFMRPGETKVIQLQPQHGIRLHTYFVSGHPSIVINQVSVANVMVGASIGGHKYAQLDQVVEVGNRVTIFLTYCVGQS